MGKVNINLSVDDVVVSKARKTLTELGVDMNTAVGLFIKHLADNEKKTLRIKKAKQPRKLSPRADLKGFLQGKIWYADDWDSPLEELKEYME
jgi:hypothetical protein